MDAMPPRFALSTLAPAAALVVAIAPIAGCGTRTELIDDPLAPPPAAPPAASECTHNADCVAGSICVYATAEGCAATGSCIRPVYACDAPSRTACQCSGGPVTYSCEIPDGYATTPVAHLGGC